MRLQKHPPAALAVATLLTGVLAGAAGAALTLLLHLVQHLAYGYTDEAFVAGSQQASGLRRVVAMTAGGALVGVGWWALQRWSRGNRSVTVAVAHPSRRPRIPSTTADAVLQIVAVGCGASLGREGAPRQLAAAAAGWLAAQLGLDRAARRTLIACGAGAGLAAVYNVPLGGALFALEILLGSTARRDVVAAVVTSAVATVVAWPVVGDVATYRVPAFSSTGPLIVGAVLIGPASAAVGWAFVRLTSLARTHAARGWQLPAATTLVFAAVGAVAVGVPLVLGNGKGPAALAFTGTLGLLQLALLVPLKPLATAACLRAGAVGGLLTPAVATGGVLGALIGEGWTRLWPGVPVGAYAVVGAAALLATTQRAPLTAAVLTVEFTHTGAGLLISIMLAIGGAAASARLLPRPGPRAFRVEDRPVPSGRDDDQQRRRERHGDGTDSADPHLARGVGHGAAGAHPCPQQGSAPPAEPDHQ